MKRRWMPLIGAAAGALYALLWAFVIAAPDGLAAGAGLAIMLGIGAGFGALAGALGAGVAAYFETPDGSEPTIAALLAGLAAAAGVLVPAILLPDLGGVVLRLVAAPAAVLAFAGVALYVGARQRAARRRAAAGSAAAI